MNEPTQPCPTCGTECTTSWAGLDLVANTGDETLATKCYHPFTPPEYSQLREALSALVDLHLREMEGLQAGMPKPEEWKAAVFKALDALKPIEPTNEG